jgi:zinc protease
VLFALLAWLVYSGKTEFSPQSLIASSELKGRRFQGQVEEITGATSGVKGYFMSLPDSPLVSISLIFNQSGSAYEALDKQGLTELVASTLSAGTKKLSAKQVTDALRLYGADLNVSSNKDSFTIDMSVVVDQQAPAAELLAQILQAPKFEKPYVQTAQAQILKALEAQHEQVASELGLAFATKLYGEHPYGRDSLGTPETVMQLTSADLQAFVQNHFAKNNVFIGIAGKLQQAEAVAIIDMLFAALPDEALQEDLPVAQIDYNQAKLQIQRKDGQNMTTVAVAGTCRKCEDFYPLYMANYLFGGAGLNSRLNQRIREQEGLTYGGYSALALHDKANLVTAGFSATADKYAQADKAFKEEWLRVSAQGFTEEELQSAKNYLTASYNLRFASTSGIAEMLAAMQKYDLGLDFLQKRNEYVENVTLQQLNQAAARYFVQPMVQVEIGTFTKGED